MEMFKIRKAKFLSKSEASTLALMLTFDLVPVATGSSPWCSHHTSVNVSLMVGASSPGVFLPLGVWSHWAWLSWSHWRGLWEVHPLCSQAAWKLRSLDGTVSNHSNPKPNTTSTLDGIYCTAGSLSWCNRLRCASPHWQQSWVCRMHECSHLHPGGDASVATELPKVGTHVQSTFRNCWSSNKRLLHFSLAPFSTGCLTFDLPTSNPLCCIILDSHCLWTV